MAKQSADQKGIGTKFMPKSVDVGKSKAKIPSKTVSTSPNSAKRGKQGE